MSEAGSGSNTTLVLFSSEIERDAALGGAPPQLDGVVVAVSGVGPVLAALGAARAIGNCSPRQVLFLGTCGAYPGSGVEVGEIVAAGEMLLTGADIVEQRMRLPELAGGRLRADALVSGCAVRVACTLGITEHDPSAVALAGVADVETMEVYGVACAAQQAGIPFSALLGVTNMVGEGGGRGWRENFREMMARVWGEVRSVLEAAGERESHRRHKRAL